MPFVESNGVRYFSFDIFPKTVTQAIFTRHGGVSPEPWNTLNVGGTVGDDVDRVRENRTRTFEAVGRHLDSTFDVWQVHSADAVPAEHPRPVSEAPQKADIILTNKPHVTLYMRFADCVPLFLYDARNHVVAIAHAGWLGTVRGATTSAVANMSRLYGTEPADIRAGIGPSIGPDHYEIGPDVVARVEQAFGPQAQKLIDTRNGRTYFDLWEANKLQLNQAGVEQVEISGLCTACHTDDWFSHRAEKGKTGRFGALIALAS
jgi:YfiH family protein